MVDIDQDQDQQETPIKMFFSTSEIQQKVLTRDDASIAYIIMQNNELHTKVSEFKNKVILLRCANDEFEIEVESLTKTRTCLQGYMKNEVELANKWKLISNTYEKELKSYLHAWTVCIYISMLFYVMNSIIRNIEFRLAITFIYIPTFLYYVIVELNRIKKNYINDTISEAKIFIDKIEKSNTYIQDLIDNI
jgi:hypothetical protein